MDVFRHDDEPCYVISVAARLVELHPQTLRYYERMGLVKPTRSEGNLRLYSPRDIERLRKIIRLVDELGVNLAGVEVILNMADRMEQLQQQLGEMEAEIARLRRLVGEIE
jgi:MerR family transcriptional regulator/heat shock protein HspR